MTQALGKYRLLRQLAIGGMGEVFLARHEGPAGFAKPVVIKRILPHLAKEASFVEMFLNEARVAAQLTHPNVVQIFELGEIDETWYIAMEYIHGRTLRTIVETLRDQQREFKPVYVAHFLVQALAGLQYAHSLKGAEGESMTVVHRDMSPDNIMVGFDGQVKVLDFGIAKAVATSPRTRSGTVKGKVAYMPPEQLLGTDLDGRADVYAVGIILFELLAGKKPYVAVTEPALVNLILNTPAPSLKQLAPNAPDELVEIAEKALKKNRDERFASAREMAQALEAYLLTVSPQTNSQISEFMNQLFPGDSAERVLSMTPTRERLAKQLLASGDGRRTEVLATPSSEVDLGSAVIDHPGFGGQRAKRRMGLVALVAGLAVAVVAGALFRFGSPQGQGGEAPAARVELPAPATVSPEVPVAVLPPPAPSVPPAPEAPDAAVPVVAAAPDPRPTPSPPKSSAGLLDLRVNPYAEVFSGPKRLGLTPMAPLRLPAGVHVLTLRNDELKLSRKVTAKVAAGSTTVLRVDLLDP